MVLSKQFIISLLPLLLFFVGDYFLEPFLSAALVIGFMLVEIGYAYYKTRKVETYLWIELALLFILSSIDLIEFNELIYKELIYLLLAFVPLLIFAILNKNLVTLLMGRFSDSVNSFQQYQFKKLSYFLSVVTGIATVLLLVLQIYTYLSGVKYDVIYPLVSLFTIAFIVLIIKSRLDGAAYAKESWVPIVTEDGAVETHAPRSVVHNKSFLLHPVVHLHILGDMGIYLQKRPLHKKIQPGKWDTAVGGHVDAGETIEKALFRETEEELGIQLEQVYMLNKYIWESEVERELVYSFYCFWSGNITPNETELDGGKFWTIQEIDEAVTDNILTNNFLHEYGWVKKILNSKNLISI